MREDLHHAHVAVLQEWANAVFLFVHVGPGAAGNVFREGGRLLRWGAWATHTPASPAITRLVHSSTGFGGCWGTKAPQAATVPSGIVPPAGPSGTALVDSSETAPADPAGTAAGSSETSPAGPSGSAVAKPGEASLPAAAAEAGSKQPPIGRGQATGGGKGSGSCLTGARGNMLTQWLSAAKPKPQDLPVVSTATEASNAKPGAAAAPDTLPAEATARATPATTPAHEVVPFAPAEPASAPPSSCAAVPSRDASSEDEEDDVVIPPSSVALICRVELEPYVWCGSLEYVSHDPTVRPIQFMWRLKNFDTLQRLPEFQRVVQFASS